MSDAREAFHDLHGLAGAGFDDSTLAGGPEQVERRVARRRDVRAAMVSVASIAVIAVVAVGVNESRGIESLPGNPVVPDLTTSATPAPGISMGTADPVGCAEATVVSGKPVGRFGGREGWFNGTPVAPCDEWDQQILDHPDTVLIYTGDNTMVEAYYRTSIDALGPYADLGPDFLVPEPDPDWPAESLVLIDARTGEVLETSLLSDYPTGDLEEAEQAELLDARLLRDADALAARLEAVADSAVAPEGFEFDSMQRGSEPGNALMVSLHYEPTAPEPEGRPDPGSVLSVNLLSDGGDDLLLSNAVLVASDVVGAGSVLQEISHTNAMQLSIPIGESAHLMIVGQWDAADAELLVAFAREILASTP